MASKQVLDSWKTAIERTQTDTQTHTNAHLIKLCSFFTMAGRNTGHDVLHSVEWASTAINSPERTQIWRTGGGDWWDHTYPYVCVCVSVHTQPHTKKACSWGNGVGVRLTSCTLTDIHADRTAGRKQSGEREQAEHTAATERRVWGDIDGTIRWQKLGRDLVLQLLAVMQMMMTREQK